jgi:hypothetical protein
MAGRISFCSPDRGVRLVLSALWISRLLGLLPVRSEPLRPRRASEAGSRTRASLCREAGLEAKLLHVEHARGEAVIKTGPDPLVIVVDSFFRRPVGDRRLVRNSSSASPFSQPPASRALTRPSGDDLYGLAGGREGRRACRPGPARPTRSGARPSRPARPSGTGE